MYEKFYVAVGKTERKTVTMIEYTMENAERAVREIMKCNPDIRTVAIENRKGEVIKVIKRWGK